MHCKFCGFGNGEDDHRCLRCGRRTGIAIAAPAEFSGANALALAPQSRTIEFQLSETQDFIPAQGQQTPVQPRLFIAPTQKVIAFDELQRHITGKLTPKPAASRGERPQRGKSSSHVSGSMPEQTTRPAQTTMDFVAGGSIQRTLKTSVPTVLYCEQPVATPTHRFVASSIDAAMILLGFGLFVGAVELTGGSLGHGKVLWMVLGGAFALISMLYGLLWAIAGRETAGMALTDLQLITFDGFPVDARSRASRFASTWLSFCSGGLGVIWAVADEEKLTWHDHISKTFPTIREVPKSFVQQRR